MSGSIQGADKWICLSPIPKVFLSLICTTEAWEKKTKTNNKESLKRVRKGPAENREKTQGTQYSEAGSLLADRQRVLVAGTSLPSCSSKATSSLLSWAGPGLPKDILSHCPAPAAPHTGGTEGTPAVGWEVAAGDVPISETVPWRGR